MCNDLSSINIENRRFTYINAAGELVVLEVGDVLERVDKDGVRYEVNPAWVCPSKSLIINNP